MAGIGFELRRVVRQGGALGFIGASLAGTVVVAGPWILSLLGIVLIQRYAGLALSESPALFTSTIVYSSALSLVLFTGLHYVFSRQVSDLVYVHKDQEAGSALLAFLLGTIALACVLAAAGVLPLRVAGTTSRPGLFLLGAGLLFVGTSANWVLMSFISLLRSYVGIFLAYLAGSLASFAGTFLLGRAYGTGGALLGYSVGQWVIVIILYGMTLESYRPAAVSLKGLMIYLRRYRLLFLAGALYAGATWVDKIVFWFAFGTRVPGTWWRLYDRYDVPVFFSVLSLIPGLVYFTIETETAFYPRMREFLRSVSSDTFQRIQQRKYAMIRSLTTGLRGQSVLQGIVSLVLILAAPTIGPFLFGPSLDVRALQVTLAAVFFHALFLSLLIFLFYLELYGLAALSGLAFLVVNLAASIAIVGISGAGISDAGNGDSRFLGVSYLLGAIAGCVVAGLSLARQVRRLDHILFIRATLASPNDALRD